MAPRRKPADEPTTVEIRPPNLVEIVIRVIGTAPYVQLKFSEKSRTTMLDKQVAGGVGARKREKRDLDDDFVQAQHISESGWNGIPATAFKAAMVDACRLVGMEMTRAKMALFVRPDGFDIDDGTALVRLIAEPAEQHIASVRNATGVADVRVRPMWRQWAADVTIVFDADILKSEHVVNLLARAGRQVGIGEGRPFSKKSVGMGWGTFDVEVPA